MTYQSPNDKPSLNPLDDKEFNDPTAWGFCDFCIFMVAVVDGLLIEHRRYRNSADTEPCNGSGKDPVEPVPYVAVPRQRVSLRKDTHRASTKAYWQRKRWQARATAKAEGDGLIIAKPTRVTVVSSSTGEEIDLTDSIQSITFGPEERDAIEHNND